MGTCSLPAEPSPPWAPPHSPVRLGHADTCFACLNHPLDDSNSTALPALLLAVVYSSPSVFRFLEITICRACQPVSFPPKGPSSGLFGFVFSIPVCPALVFLGDLSPQALPALVLPLTCSHGLSRALAGTCLARVPLSSAGLSRVCHSGFQQHQMCYWPSTLFVGVGRRAVPRLPKICLHQSTGEGDRMRMCGKVLAMQQQVWRMVFEIKNIFYFLPECLTSAASGELKPTMQMKVSRAAALISYHCSLLLHWIWTPCCPRSMGLSSCSLAAWCLWNL